MERKNGSGSEKLSIVASKRSVRWLLAVAIAFGWLHFFFGPQGLIRQRERAADVERLRAAYANETQINASLRDRIRRLASDDLEIERALRIELDYQRPGETVYIIPFAEDDALRESRFSRRP